jgi:hypothetical protein
MGKAFSAAFSYSPSREIARERFARAVAVLDDAETSGASRLAGPERTSSPNGAQYELIETCRNLAPDRV